MTTLTQRVAELDYIIAHLPEDLDARFAGVDVKLASIREVQSLHTKRFTSLEQRIDGIETRMDGLEQRMDRLEQRMDGLEQRMDGVEQRMDRIENRLSSIEDLLKTLVARH